jgi:hypothetical protein
VVLASLTIKKGFAKTGIFFYSKKASLNSSLVKKTNDLLDFQSPTKRSKIIRITGQLLTEISDVLFQISHPVPPTTLSSIVAFSISALLNLSSQLSLNQSFFTDFMKM